MLLMQFPTCRNGFHDVIGHRLIQSAEPASRSNEIEMSKYFPLLQRVDEFDYIRKFISAFDEFPIRFKMLPREFSL